MKRRTVNSLWGFVVPLVLTAVLILGWRAPLFLRGGGEMMYFLLAVAMGYPALGVFCGIVGVRSGFAGKWLAVPFMAALGVMMARGMHLPGPVGLIFAFWGAVVTILAILYAMQMRAGGRW